MEQATLFRETETVSRENIRLNPDGYSIESCKIIYAPKGRAGEYSRLATNPYTGCGHACVYCYVPLVLRMKKEAFDSRSVERKDYLAKLEKDAQKYHSIGTKEQVLLSFTTDPYHPFDNSLTRETLKTLIRYNIPFATLTKGGSRALRDIDLFRPGIDNFASTMTSMDNDMSRRWEPQGALPEDRAKTLEAFHGRGISTWVSLEPSFSAKDTIEVIERTHPFVDLYKLGKINYNGSEKSVNWQAFTSEVTKILRHYGKAHYVKKDLQDYIGSDYHAGTYVG